MISKEEVIHIAKLARLDLTEKELSKMQKDLSSILDYFNLLKNQKPKIKNQNHKSKIKNVVRKDEAIEKDKNIANDLMRLAPSSKDGYIKVKQVL